MNKNIRKLLYLLSRNCRTNLKEISKELKLTPQAVSYQIKKLESQKLISYYTLIDSIKIGHQNIMVGLNLKAYSQKTKNEIIKILSKNENIITFYKNNSGVDFLIEFQSRNLSHFNKVFTTLLEETSNLVQTKFVFPIIVTHTYRKNYLIRKSKDEDIVTSGDRDVEILTELETKVIELLLKSPKMSIIALAEKTKNGIKKVMSVKKKLEQKLIIRKYSCFFNHKQFEIRKNLILLKLKDNFLTNIESLVEFAKQHPNIIELNKLIGEYNIMIDVESLAPNQTVLEEIREQFPIEEHLILNVDKQF